MSVAWATLVMVSEVWKKPISIAKNTPARTANSGFARPPRRSVGRSLPCTISQNGSSASAANSIRHPAVASGPTSLMRARIGASPMIVPPMRIQATPGGTAKPGAALGAGADRRMAVIPALRGCGRHDNRLALITETNCFDFEDHEP